MLNLRALHKTFGAHHAVRGVSFDVADGERVALLGPNGAGKTTTLMMALGVTTVDSGEVLINGVSIHDDRARALESVGFAAAYMTPPRSLKVRETLRVAAGLAGQPIRSPIVDELIERFEIGHLINRFGGELSSGQKTLVGLARACMGKPPLLVLDEPTAYLDPSMALKVRALIEDACRDWGSSLLITSHNMRDIDHLCERVVFLRLGEVIYDLSPDALRQEVGHENLDDAFIDIANVNTEPEEGERSHHAVIT